MCLELQQAGGLQHFFNETSGKVIERNEEKAFGK
jgi:hypothetical protein